MIMLFIMIFQLLFGAYFIHGYYVSSLVRPPMSNENYDHLPPSTVVLETKLITAKTAKLLKEKYTTDINSEVHFNNNWYLGCSDLAGLAPYIRIVLDRLFHGDGKRQLIFDVGANNGQDASTILGIFQPVIGIVLVCSVITSRLFLLSLLQRYSANLKI